MSHRFADRWKAVEMQLMEPLVGPRAWRGQTSVGRLRAILEAQGVPDGSKDELLELWRLDGRLDVQGDHVALVRRTWRWADIQGVHMRRAEYRYRHVTRRRPVRMMDWCYKWAYPVMCRRG